MSEWANLWLSVDDLASLVRRDNPSADKEAIRRAYALAAEKHKGRARRLIFVRIDCYPYMKRLGWLP